MPLLHNPGQNAEILAGNPGSTPSKATSYLAYLSPLKKYAFPVFSCRTKFFDGSKTCLPPFGHLAFAVLRNSPWQLTHRHQSSCRRKALFDATLLPLTGRNEE